MFDILFYSSVVPLLIIVTSIWVYFDAQSIGIRKGQSSGFFNMSPLGWSLSCALLWIITFPIYIGKRGYYQRINRPSAVNATGNKPTDGMTNCPNCGRPAPAKFKNCPYCKTPLFPDTSKDKLPILLGIVAVLGLIALFKPAPDTGSRSGAALSIPAGNPLITQYTPPARRLLIKIESQSMRWTDSGHSYRTYAWQTTLHNPSSDPVKVYVEFQLLDENNFILKMSNENTTINPGNQIVRGTGMIKKDLAGQVKKTSVKINQH